MIVEQFLGPSDTALYRVDGSHGISERDSFSGLYCERRTVYQPLDVLLFFWVQHGLRHLIHSNAISAAFWSCSLVAAGTFSAAFLAEVLADSCDDQ